MDEIKELSLKIENNINNVLKKLKPAWANHMAARYNGPVYLLGSILHKPEPRDYDIRVWIEDTEFSNRYGIPLHKMEAPIGSIQQKSGIVSGNFVKWYEDGPSQRWVDDVAKFNSHLSKLLEMNIDMQIWPKSHWRTPYPEPILLASPSTNWWVHNSYFPDVITTDEE